MGFRDGRTNSSKGRSKSDRFTFNHENQEERMRFVSLWAEYVRTHDDKDWSQQQNMIIDSCLKTANMSKETYLAMKKKV